MKKSSINGDYDLIPYDSVPISDCHLYRLEALARLFSLQVTPPMHARILELGCAEGGTLIPMASMFPHAQFLGKELSVRQVAVAQQTIDSLGLRNVHIEQADILDLNDEIGQFDYIIVHGVLSWVPVNVQNKIFAIVKESLAPQGIAYLSYNVYPGWRSRGAVRDMLRYHVRNEQDPQAKIRKANEFCEMMRQNCALSSSPTMLMLAQELEGIEKSRASYFFHEYLESVNQPLFFHEFVAKLSEHGLNYVCDAALYTMFPSSHNPICESFLESFTDVSEGEQYIDFLTMRTFRQSIVCHGAMHPAGEIDVEILNHFHVYSELLPSERISPKNIDKLTYANSAGNPITVQHAITKVALWELYQVFPNTMFMPDLFSLSCDQLKLSKEHSANLNAALCAEFFNLFANRLIGLCSASVNFKIEVGPFTLTQYAAYLLHRGDKVLGTVWSQTLELDDFSLYLLAHLRGCAHLQAVFDMMQQYQFPNNASQQQANEVQKNCLRLLNIFRRNGLLQQAPKAYLDQVKTN